MKFVSGDVWWRIKMNEHQINTFFRSQKSLITIHQSECATLVKYLCQTADGYLMAARSKNERDAKRKKKTSGKSEYEITRNGEKGAHFKHKPSKCE